MTFRREILAEGVEVYLGDCLEVLPTLGKFDQFVTSPPYNLGNTSGGGFSGKREAVGLGKRGGSGKWSGGALANGYGLHDDNMEHAAYVDWQKRLLQECWNHLNDAGAVYYNHKPRVLSGELVTPLEYNPNLPVRQIVIWARAGGINFSPTFYCPTHEWLAIFAKPDFKLKSKGASGVGDVWYIPQQSDLEHPAPFPLQLAMQAIETTLAASVCDPFAGSGTVGVACVKLGRKFTGIELEPKHFETACRRIEAAIREPSMFVATPKPAEQLSILDGAT